MIFMKAKSKYQIIENPACSTSETYKGWVGIIDEKFGKTIVYAPCFDTARAIIRDMDYGTKLKEGEPSRFREQSTLCCCNSADPSWVADPLWVPIEEANGKILGFFWTGSDVAKLYIKVLTEA